MQVKALELVPRCSQCYGDSPKAYKREQIQPMANVTSEYQAAFKEWPWHPRMQSMKPDRKSIFTGRSKAHMERKSIYGLDFVFNPPPKKNAPKKQKSDHKECTSNLSDETQPQVYFPKKAIVTRLDSPNVENAKVIHPSNSQPFQADTIYNVSYTPFDVSTMESCKQSPIKGKDNLEIQASRRAEVQRSTAQEDFIHHKNVVKPDPIRPVENAERPTEPIEKSTEYKDCYSGKRKNAHLGKGKPEPKFEAISTAMADFRKPEGFEKPVPCPPSVTNHFVSAKFDGRTTFSMAYKPFPVKRYELPIWAKKPTYKRPEGGMIVNSLYMHDYRDPKVIRPPDPIKPDMWNKYQIIMKDKGDRRFEDVSTYKHDFLQWENVHPRESYRIIEIYQPPKEKMVCETNHRSDFTGLKADKMKPCRHTSQHRELNTDTGMTFVTTYAENFRMVRPKSTPSAATVKHGSAQQRSVSAMEGTANPPKTSRTNKIPTPDLNIPSEQASLKPDAAANNSAQTGQGQVDILKIDHTCDKCKHNECKCKNGDS